MIERLAALAVVAALAGGCSAPAPESPVASSSAAIEPGGWKVDQPAASPPPRYDAAMAWDSVRHRVVLFGGVGDAGPLDDTWEWDGTTWTEASVAVAPQRRSQHALAFDAARGVTVLFGGADWLFNPLGDTWEWDGTQWTERCVDAACEAAAPAARSSHALAWDPNRKTTVAAGGAPADSYEWDGSTWKLLTSSVSYDEQLDAVAAYDEALGHVEMLDNLKHTFFELVGASWTPRTTPTDPGLNVPTLAMAYDAAGARMVLFGGRDSSAGTSKSDTWEWDGSGWTKTATAGPSPRSGASLAWDGVAGSVMLFGGADDALTPAGDTWHYRRRAPNGTACASPDECLSGACTNDVCCDADCKGSCNASGKCVVGATCDGDHTLHSDTGDAVTDCSPYACSSDGTCKPSCASVDDCAKGSVCDANGRCGPPASSGDSTDSSSGCSSPRTRPRSAWGCASVLLLAALLARRVGWRSASDRA